ncbi:MAG: cobalamin biosynthesis protein [Thermoproteota archaeon]
MIPPDIFLPFIPLLIFGLALMIDLIVGEPPDKLHPSVWMGKTIRLLKSKIKNKNPKIERLTGVLLALSTTALFVAPVYLILPLIHRYLGVVAYVIVAAILLKPTFALTGMEFYTLPIAQAVEKGRINQARKLLPYIVGRNPKNLNEQQIISATIESIGESNVDGITSPFFYFALFGVPGAIAYRVINTLDSMVGHKDPENINIGWFSAKLDTVANYVPSRLTALLMIVAAWLLRKDWKSAWKILQRDKNNTESLNSGWCMSAIAGALNVKLQKPDFYTLGDDVNPLSPENISEALNIMKLTSFLFGLLVIIPILITVSRIAI